MRIGFVERTGPYSSQNIDTVYELSKRAIAKGHQVDIFLYEDGTINLNKNIKSPGERNIADRMIELIGMGVKVSGCGLCAKFRGIGKDVAIDGTKIAGMAVLASMVENCDRIITFSF